jgi:hypothetical protein
MAYERIREEVEVENKNWERETMKNVASVKITFAMQQSETFILFRFFCQQQKV